MKSSTFLRNSTRNPLTMKKDSIKIEGPTVDCGLRLTCVYLSCVMAPCLSIKFLWSNDPICFFFFNIYIPLRPFNAKFRGHYIHSGLLPNLEDTLMLIIAAYILFRPLNPIHSRTVCALTSCASWHRKFPLLFFSDISRLSLYSSKWRSVSQA